MNIGGVGLGSVGPQITTGGFGVSPGFMGGR
jgi:hypothetical protein